MHEIESWIQDAVNLLDVSFKNVDRHQAQDLLGKARSIYVDGDPRVWWLSLKLPYKQFSSDTTRITDIISGYEESCWFIPETDTEELLVYRATVRDVERVVNDCPFFEYYILA